MTTVRRRKAPYLLRVIIECKLLLAVLGGLMCCTQLAAQQPPVHRLLAGSMPPGAIGSIRHLRGGALAGYFQPIEIRVPNGARVALAVGHGFGEQVGASPLVGMLIGPVYRTQVTIGVPNGPDVVVYPTIEVVDRLYPPAGLAKRHPIPVELTPQELRMAASGSMVTRIIYVEDPQLALPVRQKNNRQRWVEASTGEDPLVAAEAMGRPVAILRIGSRAPTPAKFNIGCPPFIWFAQHPTYDPAK